jgi:hypothetical protein
MIVDGSAALAGCVALAKMVLPKRYITAKPLLKYPGRLKAMGNIESQAEWSG